MILDVHSELQPTDGAQCDVVSLDALFRILMTYTVKNKLIPSTLDYLFGHETVIIARRLRKNEI